MTESEPRALDLLVTHGPRADENHANPLPLCPLLPVEPREIAAWVGRDGRFAARAWDPTFREDVHFDVALSTYAPRVVWIHTSRGSRSDSLSMIARARRSGAAIIAAGSDAVREEGLYLRAGADAVVIGDGEPSVLRILEQVQGHPDALMERLASVPGLAIRGERGPIHTGGPTFLPDLKALPNPLLDESLLRPYLDAWKEQTGERVVPLRGSRRERSGLVRLRRRPAAEVARELDRAEELVGRGGIFLVDEKFSEDLDWLSEVSACRKGEGRASIRCFADITSLTADRAQSLRALGVRRAYLKAHSGSDRLLSLRGAQHRLPELYRAIGSLVAAGIEVGLVMEVGHPSEGPNDERLTLQFLRNVGGNLCQLHVRWAKALGDGRGVQGQHRTQQRRMMSMVGTNDTFGSLSRLGTSLRLGLRQVLPARSERWD